MNSLSQCFKKPCIQKKGCPYFSSLECVVSGYFDNLSVNNESP
uniref:Uncharacterized protein n=1 Tax=Arundo donax TaxID=35708 RepID=A0A0A8XSM0_ARUDO